MSQIISLLLLITLFQGVVFGEPSPVPLYDSPGKNKVYVDEGLEVPTISGADFLTGVTESDCADVFSFMDRRCIKQCCDSFSYNQDTQTCYFKKRGPSAGLGMKYNSGWQSYSYWGDLCFHPTCGYTGGLPDTTTANSIQSGGFSYGYVSQGPGKLAKTEGETLKNFQGVTPQYCANECDITPACDAFAYNPIQNQGTCFLKSNSTVDKFQTVNNVDGWTYYWKDEGQGFYDKCYCTCGSGYMCILCGKNRDGPCVAL